MKSIPYDRRRNTLSSDMAAYMRAVAPDNDEAVSRLKRNLRIARREELTARQAQVLRLYFEEEMTMEAVGHALGISSLALVGEDDDGNPVYGFDTEISPWDRHLVDRYGVTPTTDMEVVRSEPETAPGADPVFTVGEMTESGVLFKGTHVSEVLAGALNGGLPIEGFEGDSLDLSHIELDRSLMSHQDYRNYQVFMEAELAALQDIGYTIDRKNFYGFSVYGDNLTLSNGQGYFARNADGTAYLPGQPNTAAYGVGLHIYGSGNDITQTADLLACGTAGTGIRVDGEANTLRIAPGVRVSADGAYGTGLLLAYGKGQNVVSRGEIRATGTGGAGARFDFGGSLLLSLIHI